MIRLALGGVWARCGLLAGSLAAVFLGVTLLTGTLVLGDTLEAGIGSYVTRAYADTDVIVRDATQVSETPGRWRGDVDASVLGRVRGVAGVADAEPVIRGSGRPLARDEDDRVTGVAVRAAEGVSQDALAARIRTVLPQGTEAVTGRALADENMTLVHDGLLSTLHTALGAFGMVAVLAAAFTIRSMFAITVARRVRETALLRTVGASREQVVALAAVEALAVGGVGTLAGLAGGIGCATLLERILDLTAGGPLVTGGTIAVAVPVGLLVTLVAALMPIARAARLAPLAAMRGADAEDGVSEARVLVGLATGAVAVGAVVWGGLAGTPAMAGAGAFMLLGVMVLLGPVAARPAAALAGTVAARLHGVPGELARDAASRSPRRTAGAATTLMVGIGVVTLMTVLAGSLRASPDDGVLNPWLAAGIADKDAFLAAVYAMPALAIVIALLCVAGTLTLGVHERTREIGLLRAVGATRAQVTAMVRCEALIVALFGTAGGAGLGLFAGWALTGALAQPFAVPPAQLAAIALVGAVTGVVAALAPARRASRLVIRDAVGG